MPSSKRSHGWAKRRFLPFGSAFCELIPEVARIEAMVGTWRGLFFVDDVVAGVAAVFEDSAQLA
jgi:hypothetical protein